MLAPQATKWLIWQRIDERVMFAKEDLKVKEGCIENECCCCWCQRREVESVSEKKEVKSVSSAHENEVTSLSDLLLFPSSSLSMSGVMPDDLMLFVSLSEGKEEEKVVKALVWFT